MFKDQGSNSAYIVITIVMLECGMPIELDLGMYVNAIREKISTKIVIINMDIFKQITILSKSSTNSD